MIDVRNDCREMLAIAGAMNGCGPFSIQFHSNKDFIDALSDKVYSGIKGALEMEVDGYWEYNPEANQFDQEKTVNFIANLTEDETIKLLRTMGKISDADDSWDCGVKWNKFVDALMNEQFEEVEQMLEESELEDAIAVPNTEG